VGLNGYTCGNCISHYSTNGACPGLFTAPEPCVGDNCDQHTKMVRYAKGAQAMSIIGVVSLFSAAYTSLTAKPYDLSIRTKLVLSSSSLIGTLATLITMILMLGQCNCAGNNTPQLPAYQGVALAPALVDGAYSIGSLGGYCTAINTDAGVLPQVPVGLVPCLFKLGRVCAGGDVNIPANNFSFENVGGLGFSFNVLAWVAGVVATVCSCFNEHDDDGDATFDELASAAAVAVDRGCVWVYAHTSTAGEWAPSVASADSAVDPYIA
jgi:hypothetical protein